MYNDDKTALRDMSKLERLQSTMQVLIHPVSRRQIVYDEEQAYTTGRLLQKKLYH